MDYSPKEGTWKGSWYSMSDPNTHNGSLSFEYMEANNFHISLEIIYKNKTNKRECAVINITSGIKKIIYKDKINLLVEFKDDNTMRGKLYLPQLPNEMIYFEVRHYIYRESGCVCLIS